MGIRTQMTECGGKTGHLHRLARVDLNRNWDTIGFGLGATSTNPCRETYRGSEASSEPETKAVAAALLAIKDKVRIYLSFHSYGQYWLTSWGYKTSLPLDNDKLVRLGRQAVEAIQCVTPNRRYTIGSAGAIFHIASLWSYPIQAATDSFCPPTRFPQWEENFGRPLVCLPKNLPVTIWDTNIYH